MINIYQRSMRDIKMRFFNIITKTMHFCNLSDASPFYKCHEYEITDFVPMEFTGNFDKHRGAIYESDIVLLKGQLGLVIYLEGMSRFTVLSAGKSGLSVDWHLDWYLEEEKEILGNFHQNADLLKDYEFFNALSRNM